MAGLVGSDLRSGSWRLVYDILSGLAGSIGSVYSSFPESKMVTFPMNVIDNVDSSYSATTKNSMMSDITIPITLYNKSGKNLDIQTDRVMNGLEGSRMAFMESGVKLLSINDAGQGTNVYGETTVHYRAINVNVVSLV